MAKKPTPKTPAKKDVLREGAMRLPAKPDGLKQIKKWD